MSTDKEFSEKIKEIVVSEQGSLGLLALGSLGLKMWREKKKEVNSTKSVSKNNPNGKK